jgi:hypothetical protein
VGQAIVFGGLPTGALERAFAGVHQQHDAYGSNSFL